MSLTTSGYLAGLSLPLVVDKAPGPRARHRGVPAEVLDHADIVTLGERGLFLDQEAEVVRPRVAEATAPGYPRLTHEFLTFCGTYALPVDCG